jgi:acyl-CoA thioesterase I
MHDFPMTDRKAGMPRRPAQASAVTRRNCIAVLLGLCAAVASPAAVTLPDAPRILIVGDSLSAEYGLGRGQGWVALMTSRLSQEKSLKAQVINASISGDTTAGGVSRLPALLRAHKPTHVVIELGANDALRGLPIANTRGNLLALTRQVQAAGAAALLVGIQVPPNYGRRYTEDFAAVFPTVAKETGAALVPFMLKNVADAPNARALFQADGIHPVAAAHPTILSNIWPVLRPWLTARASSAASRS